jgi:hypothetical protein
MSRHFQSGCWSLRGSCSGARPAQGSDEGSTPAGSVGSLSEDTLRYLDAHQHLLPRSQNRRPAPAPPSAAAKARAAAIRRTVRGPLLLPFFCGGSIALVAPAPPLLQP